MRLLRKPIKLATVLVLSAVIAFTFSGISSAIAGSQFVAGRIIDDVVFFSYNTMSSHDIKVFLNAKVPSCRAGHVCLKDYGQQTHVIAGDAYCANNYPGGFLSAADIIYEAGKACGINPQVLLVLLQKEQSLVTDDWPVDTQYAKATGYKCPDTASCDPAYAGFFKQVYYAAWQYRYYAGNPSIFNHKAARNNFVRYNPNSNCGGTNLYIQNQATTGLYNYTPYQPNPAALNNLYGTGDSCSAYGNRNFWRMFNDWFGASVIGAVPSPLYKSSSTQQIYAIVGGKKYLLSSPEIIRAYGLGRFPAAEVNQSFVDQYTNGGTLTSLAKKESDASAVIYLFDDGRRFKVSMNDCYKYPNGAVNPTTTWSLDCFNSEANTTQTVANELIDQYTASDIDLPSVILNNNIVWKLEGGRKHMITDPVFVDILGGWGNTRWMQYINSAQPEGKMLIPDMSLVKFSNSAVIYYLAEGQLFPAPGPDELGAWAGGRATYVFPASFNATDPIPVGTALSTFAKNSSNTPFMILTNGTKVNISGAANWQPGASTYVQLPDYALNRLPTGSLSSIFRSSSGAIFTVQNNTKYLFPTGDDFYYSGFRDNQIQPVSQAAENLFTYGGMKLSPGRLFKVTGDETIRYVYGEGNSLTVNSTTIPGLPYNKIITVDTTTGARYPVTGTYH